MWGWCPLVLGSVARQLWGWSPLQGVPACETTPWSQHSHNAAGTYTSNVRTRCAWDFALPGARRWVSWLGNAYPAMTLCEQAAPIPSRAVFCLNRDSHDPDDPTGDLLNQPGSLKDTLRLETTTSSTANVPALCPCEEWRLHHSPSVVAGGSTDDAR